jgi:hypothetical protein
MRISRLEYRSLAVGGALPSGGFIEVDGLYHVSSPAGVDGLYGDMADAAHWADVSSRVTPWVTLLDGSWPSTVV